MSDMLERVNTALLLDFYGPLLTENRREILSLYCEEDLSIGEIGAQLGITRQGVSDAIGKARRQLNDYEDKLGLVKRYQSITGEAEKALKLLDDINDSEAVQSIREALNRILQLER